MFPAYVKFSQDSIEVEPKTSKEFLQNPSYDSIPVSSATIPQEISSDSESSSSAETKNKTYEFLEYDRKDDKKPPTPPRNTEVFFVDRKRQKDYLKMSFLPNRAIPFYKISRSLKHFGQPKRKFRRYFKVKRIKKLLNEPKKLLDEKVSHDEEMRIYLIKNSHDVEKWIEFIKQKVSKS